MKELVIYLLEALACSGVLLGLYALLIERRVRFLFCRLYLPAAMVVATVIPMLRIPVWKGEVIYLQPSTALTVDTTDTDTDTIVAEEADTAFDAATYVLIFYIAGVAVMAAVMAAQMLRIRRLKRNGDRSACGQFDIVRTRQHIASFSFFRTIYVAADTPEADMHTIIAHEASHIAHRHSVERMVMELLKALLWWNPFVWIAARRLVEVEEYEADRDAIDGGCDTSEYVTTLLKHLFGYSPEIANGLRDSLTKKRLKMMTTNKGGRYALLRMATIIPVTAGLVVAFSFTTRAAEIRLVESQAKEPQTTATTTITVTGADTQQPQAVSQTTLQGEPAGPVYIINGEISLDPEALKSLDVNSIKSVSVFKNPNAEELKALNLSDDEIARGVIMIDLKSSVELDSERKAREQFDGVGETLAKPVIVIDGTVMPESFEIGSLDVNSIKSVTVIKKPEVAAGYGRKDADGVIEITTIKAPQVKVDVAEYGSESMKKAVEQMERAAEQMEQAAEQMEQAASKMKIAGDTLTLVTGGFENMSVVSTGTSGFKSNLNLDSILIVVDGKVMEKGFEINSISPNDIASITVLKGAQATGKYGDAAKDGVIEISLRNGSTSVQAESAAAGSMPKFNGGGVEEFRMWVQTRIRYPQLAREQKIEGTVVAEFTVGKNGKVKGVKALKSPGKPLSDEVMRVMSQSPAWEPGRDANGKKAEVKLVLPFKFIIQETGNQQQTADEGEKLAEKLKGKSNDIDKITVVTY